MPEVYAVNAHMCAFGMKSKDERGEGFAKKPTKFLTNSGEMARALNRQCPGDHRHVHLMAGRARAAAIYPKELRVTVCKATMRQATVDAGNLACMKCVDKGDGDVMNVEFEEERWDKYWDDLTGKELDWDRVESARAEEIGTIRQMGVWRHVPRDECFQKTGKPPIKLRWIDINKGDDTSPLYRSRIVAK